MIVFPNPSSSIINVEYDQSKATSDLFLIISDIDGKVIYSETKKAFKGKYNKDFDLGKASKGNYYVEIKSNNRRIVKKVVIQ